jgi:phage terminase large subunit-like protein
MQKSLDCERMNSFFKPLGADSDTLDGLNPHGHICDELHAHKKRGLFDVMITGMGARRQPLTFIITTAGVYDPESIGWEMHEHAQQVLDGVSRMTSSSRSSSQRTKATTGSEETWMKANPNYGVSVKPDYMREPGEGGEQRPSFLNSFLRLHLNVWTQQVTRWISVDKWNACAGARSATRDVQGSRRVHRARPLVEARPLGALCVAIPMDDGFINFFWRFWVPARLVKERARAAKKPDYASGSRTAGSRRRLATSSTTSSSVGNPRVRQLVKIRQLGFDPWNATQLATQLQGDGFSRRPDAKKEQLIEMRQGMRTLSEPSKEFEKRSLKGKIDTAESRHALDGRQRSDPSRRERQHRTRQALGGRPHRRRARSDHGAGRVITNP